MADVLSLQDRLSELKSQGKSLSTSKEYAKIYNQIKSLGGSTSGKSGLQSTVDRAISLAQNAVQPAISSYQASQPEVSARFAEQRSQLEAEKSPLQERYTNLINQIKGNQTMAENRQSVATRNELGRRGITASSGLYDTTVADELNPITSQFTGLIKDTGLQQESDLRNIANQIANSYTNETDAQRAITNAIAQLQSNAGLTGLNLGNSQYQFGVSTELQKQQLANALANQQASQDLANKIYETIQLPESKVSVQKALQNLQSGTSTDAVTTALAQLVSSYLNPTTTSTTNTGTSLDSLENDANNFSFTPTTSLSTTTNPIDLSKYDFSGLNLGNIFGASSKYGTGINLGK